MKKRMGIACLSALSIWWLSLPYNGMIAQSLLFFCMGSFFSINRINAIDIFAGKKIFILTVIWLMLVTLDWTTHFVVYSNWGLYIHRVVLIVNIFILLYYGWKLSQTHHWPTLLDKSSFWIYTTHFPLTVLIRIYRPEMNDMAQLVFYWSSIIMVSIICLIVYHLVNKIAPRLVAISMGNR